MSPRSATDDLLAVRVDASAAIGVGHLARARALAHAWQDAGGRVLFLSRPLLPQLEATVLAEGIEVVSLHASDRGEEEAAAVIRSRRPAWTVVDGYHLGGEHLDVLAAAGSPVLVIDDDGRTATDAAVAVVDTSPAATANSYARCGSARLLLGPDYVLLRREFLKWGRWRRPAAAPVERALVTVGGSDPEGVTARAVEAVAALDGAEAIAVLGPASGPQPAPADGIRWERSPRDMAALMASCDLALAGAGTTCWELAFMMVPMVLVALSEDQLPNAESLRRAGAAVVAPTIDEAGSLLLDLAEDLARRDQASVAGRSLVDGLGSARVVQCLLGTQ